MFNLKSTIDGILANPAVVASSKALKDAMKAVDSPDGKKIVNSAIELTLNAVRAGVEITVPPFLRGFVDAAFAFATPAVESAVDGILDTLGK